MKFSHLVFIFPKLGQVSETIEVNADHHFFNAHEINDYLSQLIANMSKCNVYSYIENEKCYLKISSEKMQDAGSYAWWYEVYKQLRWESEPTMIYYNVPQKAGTNILQVTSNKLSGTKIYNLIFPSIPEGHPFSCEKENEQCYLHVKNNKAYKKTWWYKHLSILKNILPSSYETRQSSYDPDFSLLIPTQANVASSPPQNEKPLEPLLSDDKFLEELKAQLFFSPPRQNSILLKDNENDETVFEPEQNAVPDFLNH